MPEVLTAFHRPVLGSDGRSYAAQACGGNMGNGIWEGWVEFVPLDGGPAIRSPRETTQPNRADAIYWAGGLGATYLEGALERALHPLVIERDPPGRPAFDRPAPTFRVIKSDS
jgi:hypothetical protein